jgi:hypothetical protein
MKRIFVYLAAANLLLLAVGILSVHTPITKAATPATLDRGGVCSARHLAGRWAISYSGTIVGFGPVESVGSFTANADGTFSGNEERSFNGDVEQETFNGTFIANPDCTGTASANIYLNGALERTTTYHVVWFNEGRSAKVIFDTPGTAIEAEESRIDE